MGHVPRKISAICSLFLWHGGRIQCEVTGTRQHSCDIPQGELEIPCQYIFEGDVHKVKKSISVNEKAESTKEATSNGRITLIDLALNITALCGKIGRESFLGGLIFVEKGIPQKPRKIVQLENFFAYSIYQMQCCAATDVIISLAYSYGLTAIAFQTMNDLLYG